MKIAGRKANYRVEIAPFLHSANKIPKIKRIHAAPSILTPLSAESVVIKKYKRRKNKHKQRKIYYICVCLHVAYTSKECRKMDKQEKLNSTFV